MSPVPLGTVDSITQLGGQDRGCAACTVAHVNSRIGDAQSPLDDGIINHVNAAAARTGIAAGQRCVDVAATIRNP